MLTRRAFLCQTAIAATSARAASRANIDSVTTISQQPGFYHGWPTLPQRKSGELLVAYSGGREAHVCPFGRVELIRSSDAGRTWSWPEVILDSPIDDRDAGACETPAGSLLITTFTSLAYQRLLDSAKDWPPERLSKWQAVNRRSSEKQRSALLGTWMLRSTDGGMTWSAPFRVPVNSPHGPVALPGDTAKWSRPPKPTVWTMFIVGLANARCTSREARGAMTMPIPGGARQVNGLRIAGTAHSSAEVQSFRTGWNPTHNKAERTELIKQVPRVSITPSLSMRTSASGRSTRW